MEHFLGARGFEPSAAGVLGPRVQGTAASVLDRRLATPSGRSTATSPGARSSSQAMSSAGEAVSAAGLRGHDDPVKALVLDELRQRVPRRASPLDPRIHRHLEPSGAPLDRLQQRHRGLALVRPEPRPLVVVAVGCVVTSDPTGEAGALAGPTARNWER